MNIFVTSPNPRFAAQVLPDKHIVKMPLETCQMLAIVASPEWGYNFGTLPKLDGTPYKTEKGAFRNHPCTIWAQSNWSWLIQHGLALCAEYTHRYNKIHSCQSTMEHALKYSHNKMVNLHHLLLQVLMNSNMTRLSISSQHTNDTLHLNLGQRLTIFVTHLVNLIGYNK